MSEDEKKDKLSEQAKNKDDSNLVVDGNGHIKDIYDIIEEYKNSSKTSVVRKIHKLADYGGNIEQVVEKYREISSGDISNIDKTLEDLEQAYRLVIQSINEAPNGIVIDEKTGELNKKESSKQAKQYGIDEGEYVPEENETDNFSLLEFVQGNKENEEIDHNIEVTYEKDLEDIIPDLYDFALENDFINEAFFEDFSEIKLSEEITKEYDVAEEMIKSRDAVVMGFKILFNESQKHPERSKKELENFMKQYPEYQENFLEIVEKGIDTKDLELYKNSILKVSLASIISKINKSSEEDISKLPEETKKGILTRTLSIMNVNISAEYLEEVQAAIQKVYPQINSLDDFKTVGKILGIPKDEVMGLGMEAKDQFAMIDVGRIIQLQKNGKITNKEMTDYFLKNNEHLKIADINKGPLQIYFNDSKVDFSENEERGFKRLSNTFKVMSWIDNKDKVVEYEFLSLTSEKERLKELLAENSSDITKQQLESTERELEEFEKNHRDFDKEKYLEDDGKIKKEFAEEIKLFKKAKIRGDILSNYIEDADNIRSLEDYNKLSPKLKTKYFRDTVFGLADNSALNKKIAMRRMEIISSEENPLITFDEDNNPNLNMELFMQKCIEHDVVSRENSDILYNKDTFFREIAKYTVEKLKSYERLPDKYFVKLNDITIGNRAQQVEFKSKQIDEIKFKNRFDREQEITSKAEQDSELRTIERMMTQEEIDELLGKMNEEKEESIEEKFKATFSKSGKDFDNSMFELIYENPMAAQEFLKQLLENTEISETSNFQTKIMFLQTNIKQVEKEKLRTAFDKDNQSFEDEVGELVTLNPIVAQEFLKEFVSNSQNASINKFNEKVMMLQEKITQTLGEKETPSQAKFLKAESMDISNLPKKVGVNLITDKQEHKSQDEEEPSL